MTVLPETDLADRIARAVRDRTGGRVRNADVTVTDGAVVVRGAAPSYYLKQMALEAARSVLRGLPVLIRLEVTVHAR
jgi:osmotically-inducible protein OsmY